MTIETVTVLIVEDNAIDVEALRRAFRRGRLTNPIVVAKDGIDALELLRADPRAGGIERPYVILLDLNLPRMNGLEVLRELRCDPNLRDSVVFVLTTSSRDEDKIASYDRNIAGYIVKGSDRFAQITQLLESYWRIVEMPPDRGPRTSENRTGENLSKIPDA